MKRDFTFYLSYRAAKPYIIDRSKYMEKYSSDSRRNDGYALLEGAPLIVSIDGTYVLAYDLLKCCKRWQSFIINKWLSELKNPSDGKARITFHWSRDINGDLQ